MPSQQTFGRRQSGASATPPRQGADRLALSDHAEAFRVELSQARSEPEPADFRAWLRSGQTGRVLAWLATFALLAPGLLCMALHAPVYICANADLIGLTGGWLLRRARRERLAQIAQWDEDR